MRDHGRNGAGVSPGYVRASVPASEGSSSDEPPPYSVCVPYPPPINSNYPETHSSLLVGPPAYTSSEILNHGNQNGNCVHEVRPCAPFLDVASTSASPPGVHEPRERSYNYEPAVKTTSTQENPPAYRHGQKTIVLRRTADRGNTRGRFVGLCTAVAVAATISIIIIAGMISQFNKTRRIDYHDYDSGSYNRKIPDTYRERKINTDLTDPYRDNLYTYDFGDGKKINLLNFDELRRALEKHVYDVLDLARRGRKNETRSDTDDYRSPADKLRDIIYESLQKHFSLTSSKTKIGPNLNDPDLHPDLNLDLDPDLDDNASNKREKEDDDERYEPNIDLKLPDFLDLSKSLSSQFGYQRKNDASDDTDINRIAKRFKDILGISRNVKTGENVQKPALGENPYSSSTIIPDSDDSDLTE